MTDILEAEKKAINRTIGLARYLADDTQNADECWAYINAAADRIEGIRLLAANLGVHDDELRDYATSEITSMRNYYCGGEQA